MKYKLIIAMLLISIAARSQTAWTNVGNGLQQRIVAGKTEYRFVKTAPYAPFGITDTLFLKANNSGNNATGTWPISITGNSTGLQSSFANLIYDGRFLATTPNSLLGVTDDQIHTYTPNAVKTYLGLQNVSEAAFIKDNKTNTPEAKRISILDSINTTGVTTFSESNLYGTVDRTVNYERLRNYFSNNIFNINTENGGSGTKRIISIGAGGIPALPTSDASQSYTLFNTNPAIVGAASGYGVTTVKVGLNQPGLIGSQVFTKASLTSSVTGQGIVGGGFNTFLGASNTLNWTTLSNQHPNIQGLSSVVGQSVGATGSIPKVASVFGTITGGGATISEANLLNLTYGHVGAITSAVGARITDVNAGTNNTFLLMNMGDATTPPSGQFGIYGDYTYNNYFGVGNTFIGSSTDNGAKLQVTTPATSHILDLRSASGSKFKVNWQGIVGINNSMLLPGQSFRTNANNDGSEAFTPATTTDISNLSTVYAPISGSSSYIQASPTGSQAASINITGTIASSSLTSTGSVSGTSLSSSGAIQATTDITAQGSVIGASGSFSGNVTGAAPTLPAHLTTKLYVDNSISTASLSYVKYGNNGSGFGGSANISFGNDNSYFSAGNGAGNAFSRIDPLGFSISNNSGFATKFIAAGTNTTPAQVSVRNLTGIMALTADVTSAISGETLQAVANRGNIYSATGGQIKVDLIGTTTGGFNITTGTGTTAVSNFTYNPATGENRIGGAQSYVFPSFFSAGSEAARINLNGNVGIGTTSTASRLTVAGGDIETTGTANGVILTAPNGSRWRVTVSNTGVLTTTAL